MNVRSLAAALTCAAFLSACGTTPRLSPAVAPKVSVPPEAMVHHAPVYLCSLERILLGSPEERTRLHELLLSASPPSESWCE